MSLEKARDWLLQQNSQLNPKRRAKKIAIASGKGGVGKTTLAIKIAMTLATNHKVLLIDCDFNLSNTVVKLKMPLNDNFYQLISGAKSFEESLVEFKNVKILSGCNGNQELHRGQLDLEKYIIEIVRDYEEEFDYIIFDCPAGISKATLTLNAYSDERIVVVTPDRSSITDSYSLIKLVNKNFSINEFVLLGNQIENKSQFKRIVKGLSETVENFLEARVVVLGAIPKFNMATDVLDDALFSEENISFGRVFDKYFGGKVEKNLDSLLYAPVGGKQDVQPTTI